MSRKRENARKRYEKLEDTVSFIKRAVANSEKDIPYYEDIIFIADILEDYFKGQTEESMLFPFTSVSGEPYKEALERSNLKFEEKELTDHHPTNPYTKKVYVVEINTLKDLQDLRKQIVNEAGKLLPIIISNSNFKEFDTELIIYDSFME